MIVFVQDLADLLGVDASTEATALQAALDATKLADTAGNAPTDPGWTPTHDAHLAAAAYVDHLIVRRTIGGLDAGTLESFTSEGSSFQLARTTLTDLHALAARLRAMSPLTGGHGIGVIEVDNRGDWFPRSHFPRQAWT